MIGPIFGGLFVAYWSWRGIFFVNVPFGILLIICCLRYMPATPDCDGHARRPLDLAGLVLLGIGALALLLGISYLGEAGASAASPLFVVPVIAGLLGLALFGRHIRRVQDPFIAPHLIAGPGFGSPRRASRSSWRRAWPRWGCGAPATAGRCTSARPAPR
jgi:hypothetical protein